MGGESLLWSLLYQNVFLFQDLFSKLKITGVRELTLGANHDVSSVSRLRWKTADGTLTPSQVGKNTFQLTFPSTTILICVNMIIPCLCYYDIHGIYIPLCSQIAGIACVQFVYFLFV